MAASAIYNAGTIAVAANGTTVTGAGTEFLAAGVRAGDIFACDGFSITIAAVVSNTSLTLAFAWKGAAKTGAAYEVRYMQAAARLTVGQLEALRVGQGDAAIAADRATAAAGQAETYAETAASGAKYFDTIALGRAGVPDGQTFGVKAGGSDGLTRATTFRRDSASTQTKIAEMVAGEEFDSTSQAANLALTTAASASRASGLTPTDFGATGEGIETSAIADALLSGAPLTLQSGKTYRVDPLSLLGDGIYIKTSGPAPAKLILTTNNNATLLRYNNRSAEALTTLVESVSARSKRVKVASAAGVVPGMLFIMRSNKLWPHGGSRTKAELHRVRAIIGNTIFLEAETHDGYQLPAEAVTLSFFRPARVVMENIELECEPGGTDSFGLRMHYLVDSVFRNCIFRGFSYIGLSLESCYRTLVDNCGFYDLSPDGLYGYGVVSYGGYRSHIRDCWASNCRKLADFSALNSTAIDYGSLVENPIFDGPISVEDVYSGGGEENAVNAVGAHEYCDNLTITGGKISNVKFGINTRGRNTIVDGVHFVGRMESCVRLYNGDTASIRNCFADEDYRPTKDGGQVQVPTALVTINNNFLGALDIAGNRGRLQECLLVENYNTPAAIMPDRSIRDNDITFYNENAAITPTVVKSVQNRTAERLIIEGNVFARETAPGVLGRWSYLSSTITPLSWHMEPLANGVRVLPGQVSMIFVGTNTARLTADCMTVHNGFAGGRIVFANAGGFSGTAEGFRTVASIPTGNTGPDTFINLHYADGVIYVENRTAATRFVSVLAYPVLYPS